MEANARVAVTKQTKAAKDKAKAETAKDKEEEEMKAKFELEGFKAGQKDRLDRERLQAEQEREGVRMGIDIAKSRQQAARPQPTKGKPSTT